MGSIKCPLVNNEVVDDYFCFATSMVAEHAAPFRTLPDEVKKIANFREICLNCPNHRD